MDGTGPGRMGWEMLDGRVIEKVGGGGERECIVRSHGRRLWEENLEGFRFPRNKPREEREREGNDSFL